MAVELKPLNRCVMSFGIRSTSPMIQHQWSEKAKRLMREKGQGKKTRNRDVRDPAKEAEEAMYKTVDGRPGIPGMGFKAALITAAHKDIGIEKTLVRKALFLKTSDPNKVLPIEVEGWESKELDMREDPVRVGAGAADLRYRPEFKSWKCLIELEVDGDLLKAEDVLNLVNRAGFGVGICEWRPEKNGEYGRFEADPDVPLRFETV